VRNTALMRLRQARRTVSLDGEDWNLWADEPAVSPEDRLLLSALLGQLGEEDRQIVVMHALAGLKHREIAAMLGMGLPAVLSRYSRGMKKLRRALKEADGHDKS
jgi:RNA polymerase sigma-70 factor (ECF subfamily)